MIFANRHVDLLYMPSSNSKLEKVVNNRDYHRFTIGTKLLKQYIIRIKAYTDELSVWTSDCTKVLIVKIEKKKRNLKC